MKLTLADRLILKAMQHGQYLVDVNGIEGLSINGSSISSAVKKGSIARLVAMEFIFKSKVPKVKRYLLTDDGRKTDTAGRY